MTNALPRHCEPPKAVWQSTNAKRTWKFGCWLFYTPYPKSAFTLIELLVYIAILGFIVVVAGRAYSDSVSMRVRSQNMIKTAETVGRVSQLITEDISQMGVKWYNEPEGATQKFSKTEAQNVYINAAQEDYSSFELHHNTYGDSLVFRKIALNEDGTFLGIREISWFLNDNKEIYRKCRTLDGGTADDICGNAEDINSANSVLIAKNVTKFAFAPSKPGNPPASEGATPDPDTLFPTINATTFKLISISSTAPEAKSITFDNTGTESVAKSFAKNSSPDLAKYNAAYFALENDEYLSIPIKKGETYIAEFNMPFFTSADVNKSDSLSTQFLPGQDHIAVGLRHKDGTTIEGASPDVLFYAPQSAEAANVARYAEMTLKGDAPADGTCLAFTFAFYSPNAYSGKLRFSNFKIYRKPTGTYHFVKEKNNYSQEEADIYATESDPQKNIHKRNVKHFELLLEIDNRGEKAGTYSKDEEGLSIAVPNNGV